MYYGQSVTIFVKCGQKNLTVKCHFEKFDGKMPFGKNDIS